MVRTADADPVLTMVENKLLRGGYRLLVASFLFSYSQMTVLGRLLSAKIFDS